MKMKESEPTTSHINTFSWVLAELSSQGLYFEEEIKALALLLSLPANSEVFCMPVMNSSPKLTLDETTGTILSKDIRQRSMGLSIDNSAEAHFSGESTQRVGHSQSWLKRREDRALSKSRSSRFNALCTHSHNIADCWSIKQGNGKKVDRCRGWSELAHS